ncbi:MAG: hypothetical protein GY883_06590 [Shimia sp.]|nr:hypothetical protein [Shimia sp.]
MEATELQQNITRVAEVGPIKVWSVVVSILGDLLRSPEDSLSGQQLDALVAPLGINNQALRVAVHRLRNDGWVETRKDGRRSRHLLTPQGQEQTQRVWQQIYGAEVDRTQPVQLVVGAPDMAAAEFVEHLPKDSAVLTSRSALVTGEATLPENWLCTVFDGQAPEWVQGTVAGQDLRAEYQALMAAVGPVLQAPVPQDVIGRTALRLAILHHWRRLRLRHGMLPDLVLGEDWEGAQCRAVVQEALTRFERPELPLLQ